MRDLAVSSPLIRLADWARPPVSFWATSMPWESVTFEPLIQAESSLAASGIFEKSGPAIRLMAARPATRLG